MNIYTLDTVMCDWVTLTSRFRYIYETWKAQVTVRAHPQKRMQYTGNFSDNIFIGQADQSGHPHYMTQASGEAAMGWLHKLVLSPRRERCTRIDLQITIDWPDPLDAARVRDLLVYAGWPSIPEIRSGPTGDTIYLLSRTSQRFMRIYQKDNGLIRYEWELKGEVADRVYDRLYHARYLYFECASIWCAETVESISDMAEYIPGLSKAFSLAQDQASGVIPERVAVSRRETNTEKWFRGTVEPAIMKAAYDHDSREWLLNWLSSIVDMVGTGFILDCEPVHNQQESGG